jgi:tetratricopeptide (TPR) repeat protein
LIEKFPDQLAFLNLMGAAYRGLRQFEAAIKCYKEALEVQPAHPAIWLNLGVSQKDTGDFYGAIESYSRCIKLKPDYAIAYFNLANTQKLIGDIEQAIKNFRSAIRFDPNVVQFYFNLANTLKDIRNYHDALEVYRLGLKLNPTNPDMLLNLGNCQKYLDDFDGAELSFRRAIESDPKMVQAHFNLGNALFERGSSVDAARSYKMALTLKPDFAECYRSYAMAGALAWDHEALAGATALMNAPDTSEHDRMLLHFAMAKVAEQQGFSENCVMHLDAANTFKRHSLNYNISTDDKLFISIRNFFKATEINLVDDGGVKSGLDRTPIFIVGMPRSGTSLLEQVLSSHSDVFGGGELGYLSRAVDDSNWSKSEDRTAVFQSIRKIYLDSLSRFPKTRFITDKMPLNFRWIGFILNALPEAKIIHIHREPVAVCWSNYKTYFTAPGLEFSFGQEDVANYYHLYTSLMAFWRQLYPDRFIEVCYEHLTENQAAESRRISEHLGLPWEEEILNFQNNTRSLPTASSLQIRKKMYTGSSLEWKKFQRWIRPMTELLLSKPSASQAGFEP